MNYIRQLNAFYDWLQANVLSSSAQLLYHVLLMVNNKCGWMENFQRTNQSLSGLMGVSENTLKNARNELKQKGLIDFKSGKKRGDITTYVIHKLYKVSNIDTQTDTKADTKPDTKPDTQTEDIYKHKLKGISSCSYGEQPVDNVDNLIDTEFQRVVHEYTNCGYGTPNAVAGEILEELTKEYTAEWVCTALRVGLEQNKRSLSYVRGTLENWRRSGGIQLEKPKPVRKSKNRFHNFYEPARELTNEQLKEILNRNRDKAEGG